MALKLFQRLFLLSVFCPVIFISCSTGRKTLKDADHYYESGNFTQALEDYKSAYAQSGSHNKHEIIFKIALCYYNLNECEPAILWFEKIQGKYPNPDAVLLYAHALKLCARYAEAIKIYENYLKLVPGNQAVLNDIEDCRNRSGK